jgi:hypothetical protein
VSIKTRKTDVFIKVLYDFSDDNFWEWKKVTLWTTICYTESCLSEVFYCYLTSVRPHGKTVLSLNEF